MLPEQTMAHVTLSEGAMVTPVARDTSNWAPDSHTTDPKPTDDPLGRDGDLQQASSSVTECRYDIVAAGAVTCRDSGGKPVRANKGYVPPLASCPETMVAIASRTTDISLTAIGSGTTGLSE
jgi:hypothetical protein